MSQQAPQRPEREFRAGGVSAAIWKSASTNQDGRTVDRWSVKIQKRYQDQQSGDWRSSDYYYGSELADLALVAQRAYEFIRLRDSEDGNSAGDATG